MKDNIKEILYYFKKYHFEDTMIDGKECKLLYDYITNLQEENKVLLEKYSTIQILYNSSKLKNEKAIEYMNNYIEVEDAPINERIKTEFKEVIRLLTGGDK